MNRITYRGSPVQRARSRTCHPLAEREMLYFRLLSPPEQAAAIRRLAASGMSVTTISAATKLSVEAVRQILAQGGVS